MLFAKTAAQVATIDSRKVLAAVPEIAKVDTLVAKEQKGYVDAITIKINDGKAQQTAIEEMAKKNPKDPLLKAANEKLEAMAKEIREYNEKSGKKLEEYKNLLYKPYIDKINSAIKNVADRRKLMQVLDIQAVNIAYLNPSADITDDVIKELEKK